MFDEKLSASDRIKAIIGTASIPFVFPPVEMGDMQLVDGGNFTNVNVGDPIERCREEGVETKDIIVDIVMCLNHVAKIEKWILEDTNWKDALAFYLRREEIAYYFREDEYSSIFSVTRGYHDVLFRYVLAPTKSPPSAGIIPINGSKENVKIEIELGYDDAKKAIEFAKKNKGSNLKQTLELYKNFNYNDYFKL